MEEADTRLTEIKKDYYEFERDIMKGALNQQTGKFIAEKVIRYLEDKLRSRVCELYTILICECCFTFLLYTWLPCLYLSMQSLRLSLSLYCLTCLSRELG